MTDTHLDRDDGRSADGGTGTASGRPAAAAAPARAGRARGRWVLLLLVLAGAVGLTTLPVWVRAVASAPVTGDVDVSVRGSAAAPGIVAAALVLLAAAAALGLVGRIGRWVVIVVVAGAGALVVVSALGARSGAVSTAEQAAAEQTGVSRLVEEPRSGPWPVVAALVGVLVVVAAVGLARASARWAPPSDRHERAGATAVGTVSAGTVPVGADPVVGAGAGGSAPVGADAAGAAAVGAGTGEPPEDERATWDALTRGDDPT